MQEHLLILSGGNFKKFLTFSLSWYPKLTVPEPKAPGMTKKQ